MFMRAEVVNSLRGVYCRGSQHLILNLWCVKLQELIADTNLIDCILTVTNLVNVGICKGIEQVTYPYECKVGTLSLSLFVNLQLKNVKFYYFAVPNTIDTKQYRCLIHLVLLQCDSLVIKQMKSIRNQKTPACFQYDAFNGKIQALNSII